MLGCHSELVVGGVDVFEGLHKVQVLALACILHEKLIDDTGDL